MQRDVIINSALTVTIIGCLVWVALTIMNWQTTYTDPVMESNSLADSSMVTQLETHIEPDYYEQLVNLYEDTMREPIEAAEIRASTMAETDGIISFISDSYSSGSSFTVIINTDERFVTAACTTPEDRLDNTWICPDTTHWRIDV